MPLPKISSIETPILQELVATGGTDNLRFLYKRLIAYFPQLSESEINEVKGGKNKNWRNAVQKAGRTLDADGFIKRNNGVWTITEKGRLEVEAETSGFALTTSETANLSHANIQEMLVEIGESLGFHAETEFEFYDVVWRETPNSPRLSHIFEVQSKGNIDSAFAKLKRAYNAQRSKPFLVLTTERDLNRARKSLSREFQDIEKVVTILTFTQIRQVHQNLKNIAEIIKEFLLK
ncbi:MAG: winged helix-turn-helix domain-containing protein [Acidobacteriota bacterium]|nr:winged helix-turn-helix domain-containing protein [Acidobacteriota bacterium]